MPAPVVTGSTPRDAHTTGGTNLAIAGTNFNTDCLVYIGGTLCTAITYVSAIRIDCKTPAKSAGYYDLTVVDPVSWPGSPSTLVNYFKFNAPNFVPSTDGVALVGPATGITLGRNGGQGDIIESINFAIWDTFITLPTYIKDGSDPQMLLWAGAFSSAWTPETAAIPYRLGLRSRNGAWVISVGYGLSAIIHGKFT